MSQMQRFDGPREIHGRQFLFFYRVEMRSLRRDSRRHYQSK